MSQEGGQGEGFLSFAKATHCTYRLLDWPILLKATHSPLYSMLYVRESEPWLALRCLGQAHTLP